MSSRFVLFLSLGSLLATAKTAESAEAVEDKAKVCNPDKYYVEWVKQFEAQNAAGVAATYTPEVVIATNAYGILNGPAAVQGFFQAVFDQGFDKAKVITSVAEADKACTWGLSVGKFELWSSKNASVKTTGDFWKIMKKGNTKSGWIADIEHAFFAV